MDVCIVGSGAGGGVLAKELSQHKLSVTMLEVGSRVKPEDIPTHRSDWELHMGDIGRPDLRRDTITRASESAALNIVRLKALGGSTMHYEGFSTRVHPKDLLRGSQYGIGGDWPLAYSDLARCYDRVESILGLSGALDNPFEPPRPPYPNPAIEYSCAAKMMKKGCDKLGLHAAHAPLAILSRPRDGRGTCNFCGTCWFGCHMGAISNMAVTYLPLAEKAGCKILTSSMATRVVPHKHKGTIKGVEFLDENGNLHFQQARAVALCGNAIETPRLLLLSAAGGFESGLANSSGLVGRNFMVHTSELVYGLFKERIDGYKGPAINGMVQDYFDSDEKRGFIGGFLIALRNAELGPLHFFKKWVKDLGIYGAGLHKYMQEWFGHSANIVAFGEMLPNPDNRVELDPEKKDLFGLSVPRVTLRLGDNEKKMLTQMRQVLSDIAIAAGALTVEVKESGPILCTHLMGTCRMGKDPASSVTNGFGQTHDIENLFIADGSLFPSSTPANPTLTIQALATHIADHIVERFRTRSI